MGLRRSRAGLGLVEGPLAQAQDGLGRLGDDLAAGRLIAPFPDRTLPMPKPYYLAWGASALAKAGCKEMQRWLMRKG